VPLKSYDEERRAVLGHVVVEDGDGAPGEVLDDRLLIACGSGAVRLLVAQREGRGAQSLDDFVNLRRWFDAIAARPGTQRAYAKAEPFSAQPAVTEEGKKLLFGQTAASVAKS